MLHLILLITLILPIITYKERKSFKELIDIYLNKLDINNAYLSYNQYISLLKTLKNDFPNYLELDSIGKTYEGNEMPLIIMKSPIFSNDDSPKINISDLKAPNNTNISKILNKTNETNLINNSLSNKSAIFFNGMHHGKEPVSMMMNIYLILHLLSLPKAYLHLFLSSINIYFVPIINIDAYKYNSEKYLLFNSTSYMKARKNRRPHNKTICSENEKGVDLNRNYDFFFNENEEGSSSSPCNEQYRGEFPFSEPETKNIKNFVDSHPEIKITINYHTWGNLIIIPFNYLKQNISLNTLKNKFPFHFKMYQDFKKEANFPENFEFGNSDATVNYLTNGDATDWFIGKKNILSFSPELGSGKKNSDKFYPNRNITFEILKNNLYGALYSIQKSLFYLKSELISAEYSPCVYKYKYNDLYSKNSYSEDYNLREIELKNCYIDEMVLMVKIKLTNYGYGTYIPGIEFNYNLLNPTDNKTYIGETNKKYFYFLAFDLKINLDNIKSICYWSYSINNTDKDNYEKNETQKDDSYKIRCVTNKAEELEDMKLFIDNEIKSLETIIVNIQIICKKDKFLEKKNYFKRKSHRFLENIYINTTNNNSINNKSINPNESNYLIKFYTKKERIIKSENMDGEIIEWKFNNPNITIKIDDFKEMKNSQLIIIKENPFRFLTYMIFSSSIMFFFICRIIKLLNLRNFEDLDMNNQVNERRALNNSRNNINNDMVDMHAVNNFENINQFQNQNNLNINSYQMARDDSEYSNSESP
jgi:hypothetical protein